MNRKSSLHNLPPKTLAKILRKVKAYKTPEDRSRNFYFMCMEAHDELIKQKELKNKKEIYQSITGKYPTSGFRTFIEPVYRVAATIIGPLLGILALNQTQEPQKTFNQNLNETNPTIEASMLPPLTIQKYISGTKHNTIKQITPANLEDNYYDKLKTNNTKIKKAFAKPILASPKVSDSDTTTVLEHSSYDTLPVKIGKITKTWYRLITETYNPENFAVAQAIGNAVVQYNIIYNPSKLVKESLGKDQNNDGFKGDLTYSSEQYLLPELEYLIANNYLAANDLEISKESKNKAKIAQEKAKATPKSEDNLESRIDPTDTLMISQNSFSSGTRIVFDKNIALALQETYNAEYRKQLPKETMAKYSVSKEELPTLIAKLRQYEETSFNNSKIVFESLSGNEIQNIVNKYFNSTIKETKAYAQEVHRINIKNIYSFFNNVQKTLGVDEIRKSKMTEIQENNLMQKIQKHYA